MINIKNKCTECDHRDTCKYSKDYIEFGDSMSQLTNKLDRDANCFDFIAEGVAQIEFICKYYKPITSTPKSSFDLR